MNLNINDLQDPKKRGRFLKDNVAIIIAAIAILVLVIVLIAGSCGSPTQSNPTAGDNLNYVVPGLEAKGGTNGDYKVNADDRINTLVRNYFNYFSSGDVGELEKIVAPFDENQKKLVKSLSEYIEGYQNIAVYFKDGPTQNSYLVSVYHETKFKDIATRAPGLTTFYIHNNDSGELYIDNRPETSLDPEVIEYINNFKAEEDVIELANKVNSGSAEAFDKDKALYDFVVNTYQKIYTDYYTAVADASAASAAASSASASSSEGSSAASSSAAAQPSSQAGGTYAVGTTLYANDGAFVRPGPKAEGTPLGKTKVGKTYVVLADEGEWVKVRAEDKTEGYVKKEFLQTTKP
ncbi:MAG: SH3 domain-containing protein [Lachnospiraceae bacterium]|nr:SH3 domain-containing protein [Lachnospiraceae bacterium]